MGAFRLLGPLLLALAATSASAAPLDAGDPWDEAVEPTVTDQPAPAPDGLDPYDGPTAIPAAARGPAPTSEDPWDDAPLPSWSPAPRRLDPVDPWDAEPVATKPPLDFEDPWPESAQVE